MSSAAPKPRKGFSEEEIRAAVLAGRHKEILDHIPSDRRLNRRMDEHPEFALDVIYRVASEARMVDVIVDTCRRFPLATKHYVPDYSFYLLAVIDDSVMAHDGNPFGDSCGMDWRPRGWVMTLADLCLDAAVGRGQVRVVAHLLREFYRSVQFDDRFRTAVRMYTRFHHRSVHADTVREFFYVADREPHVVGQMLELLFLCGAGALAADIAPRITVSRPSSDYICNRLIMNRRADTDDGIRVLEAAGADLTAYHFGVAVRHGTLHLAAWMLRDGGRQVRPDAVNGTALREHLHSACRAIVIAACYRSIYAIDMSNRDGAYIVDIFNADGSGLQPSVADGAWGALELVPGILRAADIDRLDIRYISSMLANGFIATAPTDKALLADIVDHDARDDLTFPDLTYRRFGTAPASRSVGDALIRLSLTFRGKLIMDETQRAIRGGRYETVCLVVAAWLRRLGLTHVRVGAIARDMIAGWL